MLRNKRKVQEFTNKCKLLFDKGDYNKYELDHVISESGLFESAEILDVTTKQGFNGYIESQMLKFHPNYDFAQDMMMDSETCSSSFELAKFFEDECPHQDEIYYYSKYVVLSSKMEKEIPLMALTYIERLLTKVGILMNHWNWRRILLTTLIVASKIWDDDSLENVHFPKVMRDVTLKEVNSLEKIFLELTNFDLSIKGSDYAKYYFVLRTFASDEEDPARLQIQPISVDKMKNLQQHSDKAEEVLKDLYKKNVKDFSSTM